MTKKNPANVSYKNNNKNMTIKWSHNLFPRIVLVSVRFIW